jgi:DHA2 family multidrug resistance protein
MALLFSWAGLVLSPARIGSVLMLLVAGTILSRGTGARWLILVDLLIMAVGNYWMALMNLEISPSQVIWPRVVMFAGI